MNRKYIRQNKNSHVINRNSRNYGKFQNLDDAIFVRDELIKNDWNLELIDEIYHFNDDYLVVKVIDGKVHLLAKYREKPSKKTIEKLVKKQIRNPNNSKYGLNITKVFDTYVIKKQIAGDDYIFGYYDNLEDAEFVRNFLLNHQWNVEEFSQIEYDGDLQNFKVIEVIDDEVYVLNSFKSIDEIDIENCHNEFLLKISKHKLGFATHNYLSKLTDKIPDLEDKFNTTLKDDIWDFKNAQNPLDIIFNLTPFQKSVYDLIDNSTFDEIKKSLIRYKSGNFDEKIRRNLDELMDLGLIIENQNHYIRKNR